MQKLNNSLKVLILLGFLITLFTIEYKLKLISNLDDYLKGNFSYTVSHEINYSKSKLDGINNYLEEGNRDNLYSSLIEIQNINKGFKPIVKLKNIDEINSYWRFLLELDDYEK